MLGIPNRGLVVGTIALGVGLVAGCGGGAYGSGPATTGTHTTTQASAGFKTASVSGVGTVLVDGKGRTVYVLTKSGQKNVPCTDASGCTGVWPPVSAAFKGWRLYEYTGDSGSGQANGQGIKSFGGTWYVLSPSGDPVKTSSSGGYGGGY
jgi:predicted lipoprotein with Yx(FWY)xxD motif